MKNFQKNYSMKKIFSYSLFEPKYLPPHRTWDQWRFDNQRYWYNIPTILLLNNILYNDYETVFYVSKNIWSNPLSGIFEFFKNVKCETIDMDYSLTEPAIWRMIPLWNNNINLLHTRDVDSITSEQEYKFIKCFEKSECSIGTIRSHQNHYGIACRMLAGLSSFKPNLISDDVKGYNFNFYYSLKSNTYGSDQNLMIETFTKNNLFTKENFLDCKIQNQKNEQDFECKKANLNEFFIEKNKQDIFDKIKHTTNNSWLGEPCDSRGSLLQYLLDANPYVDEQISNNKTLNNFYKLKLRI